MTQLPVTIGGARVGVLGLGRSGYAVARLLAARGASVYASDRGASAAVLANAAALRERGISAETGGHDVARLAACDWIVVSPGIPPDAPILGEPGVVARPIFSELEVASWFTRVPIAAITGTNGKTTTTALLGAISQGAGIRTSVAGNIGRAFSTAVLEDVDVEWFVLEVSSFQLARIVTFRPRVAVVLNLAPDHLDTYPTLAAYAADKARIAENLHAGDQLCLSAEDAALAGLGADSPAERYWFHRDAAVARGASVEAEWIALRGTPAAGRVLPVNRLRIPGHHNLQNALAATLAASLMGIDTAAIAEGLASFPGIAHRLETIAVVGGVTWINDSKATNVAAAAVALETCRAPLVVILGGRHKEAPYAPLAPALASHAREVLAIGEAATRIAAELGGAAPVTVVETLERAVERADEIARPGDVVLLSPACSSYDQFASFEERGDRFRALVADLAAHRQDGAA
ncbi:MAG: UDP-N-acetylmuramoyl-L-alanine--D-glutamate ligase [Gemmatimonadota bacterium]